MGAVWINKNRQHAVALVFQHPAHVYDTVLQRICGVFRVFELLESSQLSCKILKKNEIFGRKVAIKKQTMALTASSRLAFDMSDREPNSRFASTSLSATN